MQSIWKGTISFGLVSIPIQLYTATEERGISLRQIHSADGGRIRYQRVCTLDGEEVSFGDIARGYELPNGEVVALTDEDLAELPLSSSRAIDVLSFVDADAVDPIQLSRCYYCEPIGDAKPYCLLRAALERTGKVAVVKVALRGRESLALLRPRDGVLVLQQLLWPDEVRKPRFTFLNEDVLLRPQEMRMAESYVEALTGEVDREETVDRYRLALEQLVEAKVAGLQGEPPRASTEDTGTAVDLMEALRRSVEEAKRSRDRDAAARGAKGAEPAAKPARAQSATEKKVGMKRTGRSQQTPAKEAATKRTAAKKTTAKSAAKPPAE